MTTAETSAGTREPAASTVGIIRTWTLMALVSFLLSLVAYVGFMTSGGIWFTVSDATGVLLAASMIPVMIGFDSLFRPTHRNSSSSAKWIGLTGMVIASAGSIILLTSEVSHEFVPAGGGLGMEFVGFGLVGVWFLILGSMASNSKGFSRSFVRSAYAAGIGFAVGALGAPLGPDSPTVVAGRIVSLVAFIIWAVVTRRDLEAR